MGSSVFTEHAMAASSILAAPALDWLSARLLSRLTEAPYGQRAACGEPLFLSRCRSSRLLLPHRRFILSNGAFNKRTEVCMIKQSRKVLAEREEALRDCVTGNRRARDVQLTDSV